MRTIGAPGVGVATALETVFPPVPSEVVLPLAGYTASQGNYGLVAALVCATIGSVVGALVLYYLGVAWGKERLCATAERIPLLHARDVDRAIGWFGQPRPDARSSWAAWSPESASFISIPAGIDRMPLPQFTAYTAAGSLVWNTVLIGAGYELGAQWHRVEKYFGDVANAVYALLALAVAWFVVRRLRQRPDKEPAES